MSRYVGLIRNVMLGRQGLHRAWLLERLAARGGGRPVNFLTTGNVAFDVAPEALDDLVAGLEEDLAGVIGRREPVFVRTVDALAAIVAADPFAASPFEDPVERVISFARDPVAPRVGVPVSSRRGDCCVFHVDAAELYGVSRMVDGRTSGAGGLAEWVAGVPVTTRSWGTVSRIVARERA